MLISNGVVMLEVIFYFCNTIRRNIVMENKGTDIVVFFICIACLVTIFATVIYNIVDISRNAATDVESGVSGFDVSEYAENGKAVLNGSWEYYNGLHIISDGGTDAEPNGTVELPMHWAMFSRDAWGIDGKASYRTIIKDRGDECVFCLFGIAPEIKVFVNGEIRNNPYGLGRLLAASNAELDGDCEIIIEVTSTWLTGLYACPWIYSSSGFINAMSFANSIWVIFPSCFFTAFILCTVLLSKLKNKHHFKMFVRSFIFIALFYLLVMLESSQELHGFYNYLSFEQFHLTVFAIAVLLGITSVYLQMGLFPNIFSKKILFPLSGLLFGLMILRLFLDVYIDMDIIIIAFLAMFLVYEISCTLYGIKHSVSGMAFISAATIMVISSVCIYTIASSKHYYYGIYVFLPVSLLVSIICYAYYWALHFSKIEEAAANEGKAKEKMMESEIAYLTSQVQPHFQYNTLTMIQELCYSDPEKAAEAIVLYSNLLRSKIDFKKYEKLVPFGDELENVNGYLALQKMRFGDAINFELDIETQSFMIPPLCIQTLIENSIHHGLRKRKQGGIMQLNVREINGTIVIQVRDNGIGFDVKNYSPDNRGSGIDNCTYRIKTLLNGDVIVDSKEGSGTIVTISFPLTGPAVLTEKEEID